MTPVADIHDPVAARLAARAGYSVALVTGSSVAAFGYGQPDRCVGPVEILDYARAVSTGTGLLVVVDVDSGLGFETCVDTAAALGMAAVMIDDWSWPGTLLSRDAAADRIRSAAECCARAGILLVARTEALTSCGDARAAAERLNAYAAAGADVVFPASATTVEIAFRVLTRYDGDAPAYVVLPDISGRALPSMGVRLATAWPSVALVAARAVELAYRRALAGQSSADLAMPRQQFVELIQAASDGPD